MTNQIFQLRKQLKIAEMIHYKSWKLKTAPRNILIWQRFFMWPFGFKKQSANTIKVANYTCFFLWKKCNNCNIETSVTLFFFLEITPILYLRLIYSQCIYIEKLLKLQHFCSVENLKQISVRNRYNYIPKERVFQWNN